MVLINFPNCIRVKSLVIVSVFPNDIAFVACDGMRGNKSTMCGNVLEHMRLFGVHLTSNAGISFTAMLPVMRIILH